ncbi:MAG: hypothetical protein U5K37_06175 [Natrialbaceae archaeon]|nr:hypothetical protein [Natrialbaceae archaeon]
MTPAAQFTILYLIGLVGSLAGIGWALAQDPREVLPGWQLPVGAGVAIVGPLAATLGLLWWQTPALRESVIILLERGYYVEPYLGAGLWMPTLVVFLLGPISFGTIGLVLSDRDRRLPVVAGALVAIGITTAYVLWGLYYQVPTMPIYLWTAGPVIRADHLLYGIYLLPFTIGAYAIGRTAAAGEGRRCTWTVLTWSSIILQLIGFVWHTRLTLVVYF